MRNVIVIFLLLLFISSVSASVLVSGPSCGDRFIGRVSSVIAPAVDSAFATNKVIFTNIENLEGELGETVFVDILSGILKPKIGEVFKVSLRKGVLCQIDRLGDH